MGGSDGLPSRLSRQLNEHQPRVFLLNTPYSEKQNGPKTCAPSPRASLKHELHRCGRYHVGQLQNNSLNWSLPLGYHSSSDTTVRMYLPILVIKPTSSIHTFILSLQLMRGRRSMYDHNFFGITQNFFWLLYSYRFVIYSG